ncbi:hypothetical protein [Streptomyces olindensis]|uniref:hypothetical protein n=1 Tax=Streptomyces olindensis TaxID=358823 RepID=UPI003663A498
MHHWPIHITAPALGTRRLPDVFAGCATTQRGDAALPLPWVLPTELASYDIHPSIPRQIAHYLDRVHPPRRSTERRSLPYCYAEASQASTYLGLAEQPTVAGGVNETGVPAGVDWPPSASVGSGASVTSAAWAWKSAIDVGQDKPRSRAPCITVAPTSFVHRPVGRLAQPHRHSGAGRYLRHLFGDERIEAV